MGYRASALRVTPREVLRCPPACRAEGAGCARVPTGGGTRYAPSIDVLLELAACPDCPPARDARAMFLELGLWHDLLIALAPFAVCTAVVLAAAQVLATRGGSHARD